MNTIQDSSIEHVAVTGLHGSTTLSVSLKPGLNILYGHNGTGKTTFLHILTNLLEGDIERFTHLRFERIDVRTESQNTVSLIRRTGRDQLVIEVQLNGATTAEVRRGDTLSREPRVSLRETLGSRPVYLPAFRSVLEAVTRRRHAVYDPLNEQFEKELGRFRELERLNAEGDEVEPPVQPIGTVRPHRDRGDDVAYKSLLCRQWFGSFVPWVRFPSLAEVTQQLVDEYQSAQLFLAQQDRSAFSDVFVRVLRAVFQGSPSGPVEDTGRVLNSIRQHLESLQEVSPALASVYTELANVVQSQSSAPFSQEAIGATILKLYDSALEERVRVQRATFRRIRTFQNSLNQFLQNKALTIGWQDERPPVRRTVARVQLKDGRVAALTTLSSGERHVLVMLFCHAYGRDRRHDPH